MKYKVVILSNGSTRISYSLIDENDRKSKWVEWTEPSYPMTRYKEIGGNGKWVDIDYNITLNQNDPQESIDKLKKLAILK
jgi:hypothetical protein